MRVLITGTGGFVARSLARELSEKHELYGIQRYHILPRTQIREIHDQGRFLYTGDRLNDYYIYYNRIEVGDLTDHRFVGSVLTRLKVDVIVHLAAQSIVGIGNNDPLNTTMSNIDATRNVLEYARQTHVSKVIIASTDKVYGNQDPPYTEDMPVQATGIYETSKSCVDLLAQSYSRFLPVYITRCSNIYGPGDVNPTRLIPTLMYCSYSGIPIALRSDGSHIRNYLYIDDAVRAYSSLVDCSGGSGIYNFGSDWKNNLSVVDVVDGFVDMGLIDPARQVRYGQGSGEIHNQYVSSSKAYRDLGWKAEVDFKDGLRETVKWWMENVRYEGR